MLILLQRALAAVPTPSPSPSAELDESRITPGLPGFLVIGAITLITVLLILDMTRRVRRTRYRAEVREQLELEQIAEGTDGRSPSSGIGSRQGSDRMRDDGPDSGRQGPDGRR